MARLKGITNTCSMSELAISGEPGTWSEDRDAIPAKLTNIIRTINRNDEYSPGARQRKAILCNTIHYKDVLLEMGFEEVASYIGNDSGIVHVMLYIKPKSRIKKKKTKKNAI